jgi:hypothetical protein
MELQLDMIVSAITWGGAVLLAWGAVLVLGEVHASSRSQERRNDRQADERAPEPLTGRAH